MNRFAIIAAAATAAATAAASPAASAQTQAVERTEVQSSGPLDVEGEWRNDPKALEPLAAKPPTTRPAPKLTRWLEDWRALADPAKRTDPFDRLKYIPLTDDGTVHLTLSGQLREDLAYDTGGPFSRMTDTYGLHRLYLGADLHLGQARIFAELANTEAPGKRRPLAPTDRDDIDVQLLFADYRLFVGDGQVVGRIGRQEIVYDTTQRLLGLREGPNNRQAFDAVRVDAKLGGLTLSGFAGRPVAYETGAFDDHPNHDVRFRGVNLTRAAGGQTQSLYAYGYRNASARFGGTAGDERRTTIGIRAAGRIGGVDYDAEAMRQTGSFGASRIRAWAVGAVAGYTIDVPWKPRIGIQADFASGDRRAGDGLIGTFNPLFGNGAYFTEAPVSALSNVRHLKGSLTLRPSARTSLGVAYADVARLERGDVVYLAPLIPQPATAAMAGRRTGGYAQATASRKLGPHLTVTLEAVRFDASRNLRAVGGRDVDFVKAVANFLF